jgi:hypothetical protein
VKHITTTSAKKGGILIFLPGVQEIAQCMEAVRAAVGDADVFPLHANLSSDDQRRVFNSNPHKWKVVAATNVAEASVRPCSWGPVLTTKGQTSITIDDVIYVIDSGKVKETSYDPENGLSRKSFSTYIMPNLHLTVFDRSVRNLDYSSCRSSTPRTSWSYPTWDMLQIVYPTTGKSVWPLPRPRDQTGTSGINCSQRESCQGERRCKGTVLTRWPPCSRCI